MRKNNEGYALVFVLVVLVVLCIITVGIMEFSLRNLQSQQATIQRMKEKYEAAGQIEQVLAAAENKKDAKFEESGKFCFVVDSEENELRLSSSSGDGNVWIIAKLVPGDEGIDITETFGQDSNFLTIVGDPAGAIQVSEYRIVDQIEAWTYVGYEPNAEQGEDMS